MLRPSRVVEQMQGIPFFIGKSSSNCSVCGRPLTAHESVARGIGPVCVRKHMGPGAHPSGSPQSAHAGGRGRRKGRKTLEELSRTRPASIKHAGTGVERAHVADFGEEGKALVKKSTFGSADSEFMVYEFSESIGWGIVPETIKTGPDTTIQRWVKGRTPSEIEVGDPREILPRGQMAAWVEGVFRKDPQMLVMDVLMGNNDRHLGNILLDNSGKQWAIDNNKALSVLPGPRWGLNVAKGWGGLIDAAKDVRRWFKTPAYSDYVAKLEKTHGKRVARQFGLNVADLVDWSRKAKVME